MDERNEFIFEQKNALRKMLGALRSQVCEREQKEKAVADALVPMLGGNCMIYVSIGSETDTRRIIKRLLESDAVRVYVPYTVDSIIVPRRLVRIDMPYKADKRGNLPEDCYAQFDDGPIEMDYCVTPLLGFNAGGYRIGYGKGCYDRFFSHSRAYKIGLAFDVQRCEFIAAAHDLPLDCCITERGVLYFNHEGNLG